MNRNWVTSFCFFSPISFFFFRFLVVYSVVNWLLIGLRYRLCYCLVPIKTNERIVYFVRTTENKNWVFDEPLNIKVLRNFLPSCFPIIGSVIRLQPQQTKRTKQKKVFHSFCFSHLLFCWFFCTDFRFKYHKSWKQRERIKRKRSLILLALFKALFFHMFQKKKIRKNIERNGQPSIPRNLLSAFRRTNFPNWNILCIDKILSKKYHQPCRPLNRYVHDKEQPFHFCGFLLKSNRKTIEFEHKSNNKQKHLLPSLSLSHSTENFKTFDRQTMFPYSFDTHPKIVSLECMSFEYHIFWINVPAAVTETVATITSSLSFHIHPQVNGKRK